MNRPDMIRIIADRTGRTQKETADFLNVFQDTIAEALTAGDVVRLSGFGKFETRQRKGRTGRDPATGEPLQIGPSVYVRFTTGTALKEKLLGGPGSLRSGQ